MTGSPSRVILEFTRIETCPAENGSAMLCPFGNGVVNNDEVTRAFNVTGPC
jgi:hypothetical protein